MAQEEIDLIVDTLVAQVREGTLKLEDIEGVWKERVEEALKQ